MASSSSWSPSLNRFLEWADSYLNFERTPKKNIFWLDTMEFFCKKLNSPQKSFKSFHVAGSKGKGSVSLFLASILKEAGFKTGLYASPHILDFSERITLCGKPFPEKIYEASTRELMDCVDSTPLEELPGERPVTWFELVTLLSFLCFKNAKVDWAVFEVGLGGRLDATNVIKPECSLITPIELEHCEFLGNTLEEIAFEKGGIIKEGIPCVIAEQQNDSVKNTFLKICQERNSPVIFVEETSKVDEVVYKNILTNDSKSEKSGKSKERSVGKKLPLVMQSTLSSKFFAKSIVPTLRLPGDFQAKNALEAALAIKHILPQIDEAVIEKGLSQASLSGRFEALYRLPAFKDLPFLVMDGAHTPRSLSFTLSTFHRYHTGPAALLFACASDKDVEGMASLIASDSSFSPESIFYTKPGLIKASDLERGERAFSSLGLNVKANPDYEKAIAEAFNFACKNKMPLLVTGSFYLVAEVKIFLEKSTFRG